MCKDCLGKTRANHSQFEIADHGSKIGPAPLGKNGHPLLTLSVRICRPRPSKFAYQGMKLEIRDRKNASPNVRPRNSAIRTMTENLGPSRRQRKLMVEYVGPWPWQRKNTAKDMGPLSVATRNYRETHKSLSVGAQKKLWSSSQPYEHN